MGRKRYGFGLRRDPLAPSPPLKGVGKVFGYELYIRDRVRLKVRDTPPGDGVFVILGYTPWEMQRGCK